MAQRQFTRWEGLGQQHLTAEADTSGVTAQKYLQRICAELRVE